MAGSVYIDTSAVRALADKIEKTPNPSLVLRAECARALRVLSDDRDARSATAPSLAAPIANQAMAARLGAEPLEAQIRAAYLRLTGGHVNQFVKLAALRAQLTGHSLEAVNAELRRMQQKGAALLYPIDDPWRLRPEDAAASLLVAGERRDLFSLIR
jgi:hypothetical protein